MQTSLLHSIFFPSRSPICDSLSLTPRYQPHIVDLEILGMGNIRTVKELECEALHQGFLLHRKTHVSLCWLVENFPSYCFMKGYISHRIFSTKKSPELFMCLVLFLGIWKWPACRYLSVFSILNVCFPILLPFNFACCIFGWSPLTQWPQHI